MIVALDTETELITPTVMAPKLVCVSIAQDGKPPELYHHSQAKARVFELITKAAEGKLTLVGHNAGFDFLVLSRQWPELLPLIFAAYDQMRISDTMIRAMLIKNAQGKPMHGFSLAKLSADYGMEELNKELAGPRRLYGPLREIALEYWPEDAIDYAKEDADTTLEVWKRQRDEKAYHFTADDILRDEPAQCAADWGLKLTSAWGIKTDPEYTATKRAELETQRDKLKKTLVKKCILRADNGKANVTMLRNRIKLVCDDLGIEPKLTAKGAIAYAKEYVSELNDKVLNAYTKYGHLNKLLSTYISAIEKAPSIHPSFNVMVQSGRTSCRKPNLQNLPRDGEIRECFVPRKGMVFANVDYGAAESRGLGQVMHNLNIPTKLVEVGKNPEADFHLALAAIMLKIPYEEAVARKKDPLVSSTRQGAKAANFGFPGGMGVARFIESQKNQAKPVYWDHDEATRLRDDWIRGWNMKPYFNHANELSDQGYAVQHVSGRIRGNVGFCDSANTLFQGIVADGAKLSVYECAKAAYTLPESPLYGSRLVNFVHDEIMAEVPEEAGHEAAEEIGRIMRQCMDYYTPDVPSVTEGTLTRRWAKEAKPVFEKGRLQVWEAK